MPASIFGDRFYGRREPAWHGLGTVFTEPLTASEAVQKAKLDYTVTKVQIELPGELGSINRFALVRQPTPDDLHQRLFGIVGPQYQPLSNVDIAGMIDPLSAQWPLETIGALGFGETVFMTLDAGEDNIRGDQIKKYFLVTDDKGGGKTLRIAFTPVRVVCGNTLVLGLQTATLTVGLRHYSTAGQNLKFQVSLIQQLQIIQQQTMQNLQQLALKKIIDSQLDAILIAAYPVPKQSSASRLASEVPLDFLSSDLLKDVIQKSTTYQAQYDTIVEKQQVLRDGAKDLYHKINDEFPQIAETAWAAYNAVVECEDYRKGKNVQMNTLFGSRAATKTNALAAAMLV